MLKAIDVGVLSQVDLRAFGIPDEEHVQVQRLALGIRGRVLKRVFTIRIRGCDLSVWRSVMHAKESIVPGFPDSSA